MADNTLSIVQAGIERLQQDCESLRAKRDGALELANECDREIARNAAKIEALQEVLTAAADAAECEVQEPDEPQDSPVIHRVRLNGEAKLKASAAIYRLVDAKGAASREEILGLADQIESQADDKRHILQTTVYLLQKRGKLVKGDDDKFRRAEQEAD
jgi:hypothetical protein